MERPNYVVKVDMVDTGIVESGIRLKQGDCGAVIYLKIYNDGNVYYDADLLPEVYFKRADGSTVIGKTAVGYDDMYAYTIIGNELKVAGTVIMDVKFKLEGGRESSASCSFECVADTIGETIEQSNIYWNDVVKVLSELERVSKEAETLTTNLSEIVSQIILNAEDSDSHAVESRSYAIGGTGTREGEDANNAKYYCEQSGNYFARVLENVSLVEEATRNAIEAEQNAVYSENEAALSKEGAAGSAILARSYAVGGTSTREGEDTDNAKYYYEQTREHGTDIATVDRVGIIKPDGDTISIQEDGTIKAEKAEKDGNGDIISETYVLATDLDALESELSAAVSNAQATAQSAKTDADNAKTTAAGASTTAASAKATADSALSKANNITNAYMPKSGGSMTGALNFANNTWNLVGDDAYIGDRNLLNRVCIRGKQSDIEGGITFLCEGFGWKCEAFQDESGKMHVGSRQNETFVFGTRVNVSNTNTSAYVPIIASAFTQNSSEKTKENIEIMSEEEARKILNISPVTFDYREQFGGEKNRRGVIAEEVLKIIPSVVNVPEGYSDEDFDIGKGIENKILSVDYSMFVPYLIKMMQIQQKEIENLKNDITFLQQ